jgi:hypothetical protein
MKNWGDEYFVSVMLQRLPRPSIYKNAVRGDFHVLGRLVNSWLYQRSSTWSIDEVLLQLEQ